MQVLFSRVYYFAGYLPAKTGIDFIFTALIFLNFATSWITLETEMKNNEQKQITEADVTSFLLSKIQLNRGGIRYESIRFAVYVNKDGLLDFTAVSVHAFDYKGLQIGMASTIVEALKHIAADLHERPTPAIQAAELRSEAQKMLDEANMLAEDAK